MTPKRLIAVVALMVLAVGFAVAQGPRRDIGTDIPLPPLETEPETEVDVDDRFALSIDVNLINVDVVVTDRRDNPISGLEMEHFRVFVDDEEQTITNFRPSDSGVTVVLLIEFGNTFTYYYDDVVGPAWGFIQSLRENDWAAIVAYDLRPEILTDFTQNKNDLIAGLNRLRYPAFSETVLYDAVYFALERMENIDGKKAIFLLSSGFDTFSRHNYGETLRKAEASDTTIYAVGMGGLYRTMMEPRLSGLGNMRFLMAEAQLRAIANATGGDSWFPRFQGEYRGIYESVGLDLKYQYSLGFVPKDLKQDDKLRKIRVEVVDIDVDDDGEPDRLKVRHKKGFYNVERDE